MRVSARLQAPEAHSNLIQRLPPPSPGNGFSAPRIALATAKTLSFGRSLKMSERGLKRVASPTRAISPPPLRRKVESNFNKKAVSNFFTPASQRRPEPITWRIIGTSVVIGKYSPENYKQTLPKENRRIAAFDLDSTLIKTRSGNAFSKGPDDWQWWDPVVRGRLRELSSEGFQVVIFSNQKRISIQKDMKRGQSESKSLSIFKQKLTSMMHDLEIPLSVYAATADAEYRKPRPGMWHEFEDDFDLDVIGVDKEGSFFVGDAAGRPGDHSATDRGFATNIGLKFRTPEEFFLGQAPAPVTGFDPTSYIKIDSSESDPPPFIRKHPVELVLFCGSPGSGKSTFYWNHLQPLGYERVNQDILKTRPKCLKVARELLEANKSVAVDNTNANAETRAYWTALAKELKVPIRVVHFLSSPELCRHNNAVRAANKLLNPESRTSLPGIAFGDFARRFEEPTLKEGFEDIIPVPFRFQGDEEARKLWGQYWV